MIHVQKILNSIEDDEHLAGKTYSIIFLVFSVWIVGVRLRASAMRLIHSKVRTNLKSAGICFVSVLYSVILPQSLLFSDMLLAVINS